MKEFPPSLKPETRIYSPLCLDNLPEPVSIYLLVLMILPFSLQAHYSRNTRGGCACGLVLVPVCLGDFDALVDGTVPGVPVGFFDFGEQALNPCETAPQVKQA